MEIKKKNEVTGKIINPRKITNTDRTMGHKSLYEKSHPDLHKKLYK